MLREKDFHKFKVRSTGYTFIGRYMTIGPYTYARPIGCEHYGYDESLVEKI